MRSANGAGIGFFNGFNGIIVNNLILENAGSGISGVVPANSQSPVIVNNTLVANRDSGIAIGGSSGATIIANNIVVAFSNHVATGSTLPMMWNNNFYSAGAAFAGLGPNPIGVQGNISVDPNFVDSSNSDYRLKANSLLINSGDNRHLPSTVTNDFEKSIRIRGKTVDMGAYEFQSPTSDISYHWLQANGLSRDGSSDYTDPDGDGMNNWQEWHSDTVPTNALSLFRIVEVKMTGRLASVTWISGVNRSYALERCTNLAQTSFSIIRTTNGAAGMTTLLDFPRPPGPFFYRVSTP